MTTTSRSMFTEAIEDHLALKKQNAALGEAMPLAGFDVGDPLERYPGGPVTPAVNDDEFDVLAAAGPDPAAAVAAADELSVPGQVVEGEFRMPLQPLNGMTPMLSLVEDVDDEYEDVDDAPTAVALSAPVIEDEHHGGSVVRFPGGAGPRFEEESADEATGEQPVILIDADEPLATLETEMRTPLEPRPLGRIRRPSFFGLGRRRRSKDELPEGDGWFATTPRDFDWND